ncbi:cytochrome P450 [Colletotrichum musicola]|uniref:Cytochrome P450 n=1 Tax=Colletotrichum musicola TaxID=2175873 RepID=A0A8H6KUN9_9PEZI|nr:cytochrome P450 [Colletotrichum musicola]
MLTVGLDVLSGLHFLFSITAHALRDQNLKFMHNAFRRSGQGRKNPYTFEVSMLGARTLFTSDPENIRAMLATQFNDFGKGERFKKDWFELMGNGIFNVDGSPWHESRQRLRTLFTRQRVSDLACFERHVQAMIPMLGGGRSVDMKDILSRLALDVSADFSLGRQVNSLTSHVNDDFFEAFERIRHIQSLIERLGPLNFLVPRRQFRKDLATLDEFMRPTIETAVAMSAAELEDMDKKDHGWTLLHACAAASRDKRYLRDEMVAILIAGRDTTATTLAWAFYELARNPGVLADLRREIEATVGVGSAAREPTYKDLKSMTFVTHVLNETLRLYPNAPFNIRAALKDTSLPRGGGSEGNDPVGVRAGTQVIYSTHVLQLREDLNACDAAPIEEFYPRRWESWTSQSWTYIPFNGGPRICVGQQLALTEMAYVLVRVFQQYKAVRLGKTDKLAREAGWIRGGRKPEAIERFVGSRPRMASEITLSPRGPVDLVFVE